MSTIADLLIRIGADDTQARTSFAGVADAAKRSFSEISNTPIDGRNMQQLLSRLGQLDARARELRTRLLGAIPDSPEAREMARELQQVEAQMHQVERGAADLREEFLRLNGTKLGGISSQLGRLNGSVDEASSLYEQRFGRIGDISNGIGNAFLGVSAAGLAAAGTAVKLAADYEQTEMAFTTLLGSAERAQSFLDEMRAFAAATPFEFTDLTKAATKMLAFGFAAEQIKPMLTSVGDAVAALGGGSEMVDQVTRALGQIKAKGKVSAEEMLQLAEAGIPAWEMLAEKVGVDIPTAMKLAEQGAINAEIGVTAITEGMTARFGGMMEKQAQTTAGKWSNLIDTLTQLGVKFGEAYLPLIKKLIDGAIAFADKLKDVNPALLAWGIGIAGVLGLSFKLLPLIFQIISAVEMMSAKKALDTLATKANTAAINENTRAKLRNAATPGGSGVGGGVAGGMGGAATTLGVTGAPAGLGGTLLVGGLYAVLAAAIAALGYEIYGIFKYNADAKREEERGVALEAKAKDLAGKNYARSQEHEKIADMYGYQRWLDLVKAAEDGNKKALEALQKYDPDKYAQVTAQSRKAQGVVMRDKEEEERQKRIADAGLRANEQRAALADAIKSREEEITRLRARQATLTDAVEKARVAEQIKLLELENAGAGKLVEKRIAWEARVAAAKDDATRKAMQSQMNIEMSAAESLHQRRMAQARAEGELRLEQVREQAELEQRLFETGLSSAEARNAYANRQLEREQSIADMRTRQAETTDKAERMRLATAIQVAEEEERADEKATARKLYWMDLIARTQDERLRKQLSSQMNIELSNLEAVSRRRITTINQEGDARIRQLERERKKEDELATLREARENRLMATKNRDQDYSLKVRQAGEKLLAGVVGGAYAEQVDAQQELEQAQARATQRIAEIDARERRDLAKRDITDAERATIKERAQAEREAVQGELASTTFDLNMRMADASVQAWKEQLLQTTSSLWLNNEDFAKGVQQGLQQAQALAVGANPLLTSFNGLGGLLGGKDADAAFRADLGTPITGALGKEVLDAVGAGTSLADLPAGGVLGTVRLFFDNGSWRAEMEGTSQKVLAFQVDTDDRDSRAGVL